MTQHTHGTRWTTPREHALRWGAAFVCAVALTGCGTGAEEDWHSTAVGDDESVGSVDLRSVLLVAREEGDPGRLLGTLENTSDEAVEMTISDADETITLSIPAEGSVAFDTVETLLQTVGDSPGARTPLTAATDAGKVEISAPVVDGTLDPYKPYLPS